MPRLLDSVDQIRFFSALVVSIAALVGIGVGLNDVRDGWIFAGVLTIVMVLVVSIAGMVIVFSVYPGG